MCREHPSSGTPYHLLPHKEEGRNAASPFTLHLSLKQRAAFTLAEVLITLGIIGVVAAMTMPVLITKHQKEVTVNKLKKAVSTFEQALTRAQADYGDMSGWTFLQAGTDLSSGSDSAGAELETFINNYIMRYLNIAKDCGLNNVNNCPSYVVTSLDKTSFVSNMTTYRKFITSDGTLYSISIDLDMVENDDGVKVPVTNGHLIVTVDINGFSGPNIYGRDLFVMDVAPNTKKVTMFGAGRNREVLKNDTNWACNSRTSRRYYCGAIIQQDGWQIKDDYLWR